MMNFLGFILAENVYMLPPLLKDIFTIDKIPAWLFLSLSALWILFYVVLASIVSDEKLAGIQIVSLCVMCDLTLTGYKFSLFPGPLVEFSLYLSCLGFTKLLETADLYLSTLIKNSLWFYGQMLFLSCSLSSLFLRLKLHFVRHVNFVPQVAEKLFLSFSTFPVFHIGRV